MIIARGASAVARRASRSHSMLRSPSHSLFSGGVTRHRVWSHTANAHSAAPRLPRAWCQGATLRRRGPKHQAAKGEARRGAKSARAGRALLQCPQFPRCTHAKSCVEAQRRAERDASCRIEHESGQSRGSRDLSGGGAQKRQYPNCLWGRTGLSRLPWTVHGTVPVFPTGSKTPRGAVDSGLAAVLAAVESLG